MPAKPAVRRLSLLLYWASTLTLCALPLVLAAMVFLWAPEPEDLRAAFPGVQIAETLPGWARVAALLLGAVPVIAVAFTLWQLRTLMRLYSRGVILARACAAAILRIGLGVLAVLALGMVKHPLQVLALTASNPIGQRSVSVAVSSTDLGLAMTGGLLVLIGWVMREAAAVADENAAFI